MRESAMHMPAAAATERGMHMRQVRKRKLRRGCLPWECTHTYHTHVSHMQHTHACAHPSIVEAAGDDPRQAQA